MGSSRQTGDLDAYVDRFLDLSSRVPTLSDTEARFALVNGLKTEVQVHVLGLHHCATLAAALEELRVYGHARRGAHPTGSRADFGSSLDTRAPMELDQLFTSR